MLTRLITIWDAVRSSLWALPLAIVCGACALAYAALHVDVGSGGSSVWFLFSGSATQAPQFLSSLVTAMITMATLAISITMVVLTLAAQQLGPRLIRSFMSDRRTQMTLGLFVATVVYLLLVLRSAYGKESAVPNLAVTGGTVLVLVCVATLLLFVHHLAQSIIADNVIDRVGAQLDGDIARLLPEETAEQPQAPSDIDKRGAPVLLAHGGYVQAVDFQGIVNAAAKVDAVVALDIRAGQHAVPGRMAAHVAPKKAAQDGLCQAIQNAVLVGRQRTAVQDLEFSIRQLVEIALRALSPGINDPYTANAVVDRLTLSIAFVMTRGAAKSVWQDQDGKVATDRAGVYLRRHHRRGLQSDPPAGAAGGADPHGRQYRQAAATGGHGAPRRAGEAFEAGSGSRPSQHRCRRRHGGAGGARQGSAPAIKARAASGHFFGKSSRI